jgi:uncharacterized membrane protein (UPF0182 family)
MVALSIVACVLLGVNVFRRRLRPLLLVSSGYVVIYLIAVVVIPGLFQKFVVQPSELAYETPYLKSYIDYTRRAYDLTNVQETSYPALTDLTPAVIARNQDTIENIRLWDARPLLQMYQQTQAIRLYYEFYDVGVDRYHLADLGERVSAVHPRVRSRDELHLQGGRWWLPAVFIRECPRHIK